MLTRSLAAHVDGIALGRLPPDVVAKAKLCLLDAIGCALAGASHGAIRSLLEAVRPPSVPDPAPGASVWGAGLRTGAPTAALVNASMAHVVNADDAHKESMGHPGTVVIPAALVVGEMLAAPGAALLEAVVAGYECLLRVGIGVGVASHRGDLEPDAPSRLIPRRHDEDARVRCVARGEVLGVRGRRRARRGAR